MKPNFHIYNASAGSGKTYTLVQNYLSLLFQNSNKDGIKNILAVTFTNKAAEEMKERILETLLLLSLNKKETYAKEISEKINIPVIEIQQKAQEHLSFILHNYSFFNVSTIDKFNLRLLKSFAKELNLSSSFSVEMDMEKYMKETVDILLDELGKNSFYSNVMLEYVYHNLENEKSGDFTKDLIKNSLEFLNENNLQYINNAKNYDPEFYKKLKQKLTNRIKEKEKKINTISIEKYNQIIQAGIEIADFAGGGTNGIGLYFKKAKEQKFAPTEKMLQNIEEGKIASVSGKNKKSIIENMLPDLVSSVHYIEDLKKEIFLDKEVLKKLFILEINGEISRILQKIKQEKDTIFINDFNTTISNHIQNQPSAFIYEKLGSRFQHYFFDEFQDTSQMQWDNFHPLIENAKSSESHTITLVGDPKQSIYRFRAGKPEIMLNLIEEEKNDTLLKVINLPKNFRSFSNIIDFNNEFYPFISKEIEDEKYQKIFKEYTYQQSNISELGRVQISFLDKFMLDEKQKTTKEVNNAYYEKIISTIKECLANGFKLSDIVILAKKNKIIKSIVPYLIENSIDFITEEALLISNSKAIQTVINFLIWKNNPKEEENFARFLYAIYTCNIIKSEDFTKLYFEFKNEKKIKSKEEILTILSEDYALNFIAIETNSLQLSNYIEQIFNILKFDESNKMYVIAFLDLVIEQEANGTISLSDFLTYWNEKGYKKGISFPKDTNAIKMMTIHKSKGLEFPVVIYPIDNSDGMKDKFWIPLENEKFDGLEHFYTSINNDLEKNFEEAKKIKSSKNIENTIDDFCVHYVATTRAIQQLFIFDEPNENSFYKKFIEHKNIQFEETIELFKNSNFEKKEFNENTTEESKEKIKKEIKWISENWQEKIKVSSNSIKNVQKSEERKFGDFVHQILAKINTDKDIDTVLNSTVKNGEILENQYNILRNTFTLLCNHSKISSLFSEDCTNYNERDFMVENDNFRPDRIVIKNNKYFLIDYKTGNYDHNHKQQIQFYVNKLSKIKLPIEKSFLIYLKEEIEILEI